MASTTIASVAAAPAAVAARQVAGRRSAKAAVVHARGAARSGRDAARAANVSPKPLDPTLRFSQLHACQGLPRARP